jgi:DNA modification methylase
VPFEGDKPKPATFKNGISYREHTEELYEKSVEHATERVQEYNDGGRFPSNVIGEILQADYQKYFYCPKVSRKERHIGYDLNKVPTIEHNDPATIHLHPLWTPAIGKNVYRLKQAIEEHNNKVPPTNPDGMMSRDENGQLVNNYTAKKAAAGNNHPTVKPIELMKYLIKLITPPGGTVLDPFNGSGSTGCAAVELGHNYIGCELDPAYVEIANKRIAAWNKQDNIYENLFE